MRRTTARRKGRSDMVILPEPVVRTTTSTIGGHGGSARSGHREIGSLERQNRLATKIFFAFVSHSILPENLLRALGLFSVTSVVKSLTLILIFSVSPCLRGEIWFGCGSVALCKKLSVDAKTSTVSAVSPGREHHHTSGR